MELMAGGLGADEYAARHGRRILVWSYGACRYPDPAVEAWARRVAEVLFTPGLLDACEESLRARLDPEQRGGYVATGEYEAGAHYHAAARAILARKPYAQVGVLRIGHAAVGRIGTRGRTMPA
jgi:hypothetical protein